MGSSPLPPVASGDNVDSNGATCTQPFLTLLERQACIQAYRIVEGRGTIQEEANNALSRRIRGWFCVWIPSRNDHQGHVNEDLLK